MPSTLYPACFCLEPVHKCPTAAALISPDCHGSIFLEWIMRFIGCSTIRSESMLVAPKLIAAFCSSLT
eukprot:568281-Heterocapsa_arctica.AAC.1